LENLREAYQVSGLWKIIATYGVTSFADAVNYLPRITMPLLMLNGRYDTIVSSEDSLLNKRMELLGTPADKKTQIMYDAGHVQFPKHLFEKDVANWLKEIF